MLTVVKFFPNPHRNSPNKLISRTPLKVAQINREWSGEQPRDQELWLVRIVGETRHGTNRGCFIVDPIEKPGRKDIIHLPATLMSNQLVDNMLVVTPTSMDHYWILPKDHKRKLAQRFNAYAVVVNHGGSYWF